jgi:hypothetical protein
MRDSQELLLERHDIDRHRQFPEVPRLADGRPPGPLYDDIIKFAVPGQAIGQTPRGRCLDTWKRSYLGMFGVRAGSPRRDGARRLLAFGIAATQNPFGFGQSTPMEVDDEQDAPSRGGYRRFLL